MKKLFFASLLFGGAAITAADAAIPWWQQPTICRLNPANCYTSMGVGFDSGMWDAGANCWGMKLICPQATTASDSVPVAMGRNEIASGSGISRDFDTSVLNGDCYGARKTVSNGSMASVNGDYINVWCNGILDNADETIGGGEITYGAQPTCAKLAQNGYVGVLNGRCYGKYYDMNEYFIECGASNLLPTRLIVLNGADYTAPQGNAPTDKASADKKFDKMESISKTQRSKYFKE